MPDWRVLIVEDDRTVASVNCRLVSKLPAFTVVGVAATAAQAEQMVVNLRPHLILLDLGLPGGNGVALLRGLRASGAPVEVIAVTAASSTAVVRAILHLGVIDYLVKPFAPERLRQALGQFLARMSALHPDRLDQTAVDSLRDGGAPSHRWLPKDLTAERLRVIEQVLTSAPEPLTAGEVGVATGIARVTARRYLEYLVTIEQATCESVIAGPGRPRKTYRATLRPAVADAAPAGRAGAPPAGR
ncbi:MAG: two-component system, CitB family, response regulator DctR [Solirubrobacteraceae bacterium]|jgi:two-component system CitB family response regulator|nr:two-component system, CitB family, response regulator DctR [Solirubrobacteraceae bacterium]